GLVRDREDGVVQDKLLLVAVLLIIRLYAIPWHKGRLWRDCHRVGGFVYFAIDYLHNWRTHEKNTDQHAGFAILARFACVIYADYAGIQQHVCSFKLAEH